VNHTSHDGFGKDMKQIGTHSHNTPDAGTHQSRCDNKAAPGSDAAGNETGSHPDQNRHDKNAHTVKRRAVSFFTPQHFRQHIADFIGKGNAAQNHRKGQQAKYK
jgi:hypothetical protein